MRFGRALGQSGWALGEGGWGVGEGGWGLGELFLDPYLEWRLFSGVGRFSRWLCEWTTDENNVLSESRWAVEEEGGDHVDEGRSPSDNCPAGQGICSSDVERTTVGWERDRQWSEVKRNCVDEGNRGDSPNIAKSSWKEECEQWNEVLDRVDWRERARNCRLGSAGETRKERRRCWCATTLISLDWDCDPRRNCRRNTPILRSTPLI